MRSGNPPVDHLGGQDADHDGQLVERYQLPPDLGGSDLRDVHRAEPGSDADGDTSHESGEQEPAEYVESACPDGRYHENESRQDEKGLPSVPVRQGAGRKGAQHAAGQGDAGCQSDEESLVGNYEELFIEDFRTADDDPVIPEKQSAQGGNDADEIDKPLVVRFHNALVFVQI